MVLKDGSLGIGTGSTAPTAKLEVNGDIMTDWAVINDGGYGAGYAAFSYKDQGTPGNYALLQYKNGTTFLNAANGTNIQLRINNTTNMSLSSTALQVNGTVKATRFEGDGSALTGLDAVSNKGGAVTGNLTIGTANANLEVNGTVKATKFEGDGSALTGLTANAVSKNGDTMTGALSINNTLNVQD